MFRKIISLVVAVMFTAMSLQPAFAITEAEKKQQTEVLNKNVKVDGLLDKARSYRIKGDYDKAIKIADKAIEIDPESVKAKAFLEQIVKIKEAYEIRKKNLDEQKEQEKLAKKTVKQAKKSKDARASRTLEDETQETQPTQPQPEADQPLTGTQPTQITQATQKSPKLDKSTAKMLGTSEDVLKTKPGQPIVVDGDQVEYFEDTGAIIASGNVVINYGEVTLSCDSIEVNTKTKVAMCEGNVKVDSGDGVLEGDKILYDFTKQTGEIVGAEVESFPWFGEAEKTERVSENEFILNDGYISTCDLENPHYRIKASQIKVFPNDKIIAKNVKFLVGNVPIMWVPYYYHPIIQSKAKVQFIPGRSSDWGYFLLSAWRFYIKGETKVDALIDYRSKKGFAEGMNLYYWGEDFGAEELGYGVLRAYYIHENDFGTYAPSSFRDEEGDGVKTRSRIQWKHRIDFDSSTVGMIELNELSDEYLLKDYFYNEYEQTNRTPSNYFYINSDRQNYTFSFHVNGRLNNFYTVVERLPEIKLEVPDQKLWDTQFYYTTETSASALQKEYENGSAPTEKTIRFDSFHKLSYVTGIGPIRVIPYATIEETVYSRTRLEDSMISRFAIGGGLDLSTRFHRIYDYSTDFMGLDINGLRHIISPTIQYYHRHQPTVDKDILYQMDTIDSLEKENTITFSLENKIQTKRNINTKPTTVDLVRFISSVDYEFRMEKNNMDLEKQGRFDNLKFELELIPYEWLYLDSEVEFNTKNESLKRGSIEASITPSPSFIASVGYRYEKLDDDPRNQLTIDMSYILNPKWKFGIYERFDLQSSEIEEQQFSVTRDLHCWEMEFVYDVDGSNVFRDDFTLWVAFKIKAFPDLQLGLNRSFNKRPPGSAR